MKYAEYYIKQNTISLNIEINILAKSLLNDLIISKNLINHIKASVIIKEKKKIRNFSLYRIELQLIYNDINNHTFLKENTREIKSNISNIKNAKIEEVNFCEEKYVNYNNSIKKKENIFVPKENNSNLYNKKIYNKNEINKLINENINEPSCQLPIKIELKEREVENYNNKKKIDNIELLSSTSNGMAYESILVNKIKKLNEKKEIDYFNLASILKEKNIFSKDFSLFEKEHFCKYLLLPSNILLENVNIKSIHFIFDKKLSIHLLLEIVVNKKNDSFFEINKNKELDNMLSLKKNIILCKFCNSNVISYSNINFIMPHLYLNIKNFFENAFCEECTISYDAVKDNDNNILIFSNYLSFNFKLIKSSKLLVKKNSIEHYRCMLFCNFCYNSLGYLENENEKTYSYHAYKNIHDNMKFLLFNSTKEIDRKQYIPLDNVLVNSMNSYVNMDKNYDINITNTNRELLNDANADKINTFNEQLASPIQVNEKKEDTFLNTCVKKEKMKIFNCCNDSIIDSKLENIKKKDNYYNNLKIYIFKHKIKMLLNKENIFKNYTDLLFLNEYMYNKNEKYNTFLFHLKNDEKSKIIEIKIFIKKLYICKIWEVKKYDNFLFFQKVMKIMYCVKKENKVKSLNTELIHISKETYEDILNMLISYSHRSDIFKNKFFSYLHLVQ